MKRWKLTLSLVVASLVSFLCGVIFPEVVGLIIVREEVPGFHKLREEAAVFFYDTMRELFDGTYEQREERVSAEALKVFNAYRTSLEPRCWLVNVRESYGVFCGEALFPSGHVFEVGMQKTDKGWALCRLNYMGTRYGFHDLSEVHP